MSAQVEADWFKRTGIYPIHGSVVVKTEVLAKHPWVAKSLFDAFVAAKWIYMDGTAPRRRRQCRRPQVSRR